MGQPRCSIIIPLYGKRDFTERCLVALVDTTPSDLYEVVLVDNASPDDTGDLLDCLDGDVTIIRNTENLGFSKACNQGAAAAKADLLLFLNNDTEPLEHWLEPLLAVMDGRPDVAMVGSKLLFPDGTIQHAGVWMVDSDQDESLQGNHCYYRFPSRHPEANVARSLKAITGACMLVRRSAFEAAGGFDEEYWNGNEDVELCLTVGAAGHRIAYEPASVLVHHESVSGPERWSKKDDNIVRLTERWRGKVVPDVRISADGAREIQPGSAVVAPQLLVVPSPLAEAVRGLDENLAVLEGLEDLAEAAFAAGSVEAAAAFVQAGAEHGWMNHGGRFTSPRLEAVAHKVAATVPALADTPGAAAGRVVHVLSEAYAIGGHTRLAYRWMARDPRPATMVLTQQAAEFSPVVEAKIREAGGKLVTLDAAGPSLTSRAAALAEACAGAACVVLHTHPFDVVPLLAFGGGRPRPPIVVMDHADHTLWLGASIADVVAEFRAPALAFSAARRGIDPERQALLPLPIEPVASAASPEARRKARIEARNRLGIPHGVTLLVSVATQYKTMPMGGVGLLEAMLPYALSRTNVMFVAVGPANAGGWADAARLTAGRVQSLGLVDDPQPLLDAADVYVDSTPVGSGTSILEAAVSGLPCVTMFPLGEAASMLRTSAPGLSPVTVDTVEALHDALDDLLADERTCQEAGLAAAAGVLAAHAGEAWSAALEALYERLGSVVPASGVTPSAIRRTDRIDQFLWQLHAATGMHRPLAAVLARHGGWIPLEDGLTELDPALVAPIIRPTLGAWRDARRPLTAALP